MADDLNAIIDEHMPVVVLAPRDVHHDKALSNMQEVAAREGQIIAVCTDGDDEASSIATDVMRVPPAEPEVLPFLTVLQLQLLAYHMADLKGTDVDQPRNLAKTVTVE